MNRVAFAIALVGFMVAGCAANAKLSTKGEQVFHLQNQHVVERNLTLPQPEF